MDSRLSKRTIAEYTVYPVTRTLTKSARPKSLAMFLYVSRAKKNWVNSGPESAPPVLRVGMAPGPGTAEQHAPYEVDVVAEHRPV